jgi:hypothetical protein
MKHLNHDLYTVHDLDDAYQTFWVTVLRSRRLRAIHLRMQTGSTMADAAEMEGVPRQQFVALLKMVREEFRRRAPGI